MGELIAAIAFALLILGPVFVANVPLGKRRSDPDGDAEG
jgi:hypothetical protein